MSPTPSRSPMKILFLAANPRDTQPLHLDEEVRAIDHALQSAAYRDRFNLEQAWAVRYNDLQNVLLRHQPTIVHFSGHGSNTNELILLDNDGGSHPVSLQALSRLFAILKDNIRCVVLNACYSESQAQAIAQHIEAVIGMTNALGDSAAIEFASAFYQALAYGRSIKTAFDLGCAQIDLANLNEQETPKLLVSQGDPGHLVLAQSSPATISESQSDSKYNISIGQAHGLAIGDNTSVTNINTDGGTYVGGNIDTGGGVFIGRDQLTSSLSSSQVSVTPQSYSTSEQRTTLERLLARHQRNLEHLLEQKAVYAAGEEPLRLLNQIDAEHQEINRIQAELAKLP